jgi:hypothetical protein
MIRYVELTLIILLVQLVWVMLPLLQELVNVMMDIIEAALNATLAMRVVAHALVLLVLNA